MFLDLTDAHHESAIEILARFERFAVHPVTLAEVLVHPTRVGIADDVLARLRSLWMVESPAPIDAVALTQLRAESGLEMPDCLVLLAAQHHDGGLVSFDERLLRAASE